MSKLQYFKIKSAKDERQISAAANILRGGGIVGMPTETVYGLFVNALDKEAVNKLFQIKERSLQKALTYHLSSSSEVKTVAQEVSPEAEILMNKFLPGPLMFLFKKQKRVPDNITGSSKKVGIRVPNNEITLKIIKKAGVPIVGSSANISGSLTALRPEHVLAEFGGESKKIDALVDTDDAPLGLESTILDVSTKPMRILRLGFTSPDQIYSAVGKRPVLSINKEREVGFPEFKPEGKIILIEGYTRAIIAKIRELIKTHEGKKVLLVLTNETAAQFEGQDIVKMGTLTSFEDIAQNLFSVLRSIEIRQTDIIIIEGILPANVGAVVMDKLRKVANEVVYAR